MAFELRSRSFRNGDEIPQRFAGEGANVSPHLAWHDAPEGTRSLVLIMDDPDAPRGTFTHWVLWDISPTTVELPEGFSAGNAEKVGRNDFGKRMYGGPMPPVGHGPHRYFLRLYALDKASLGLPSG